MALPRQTTTPVDTFPGARVLVVEARFYDDLADALLEGATKALESAEVEFDVLTVPGALEITSMMVIALEAAKSAGHPYDAAVALGCVIRGETTHYELVSGESCRGLMDVSISRAFPLGNGILTVENDEQAWERAHPGKQDKGGGAVRAALTVLGIARSLSKAVR